MAASSGRGVSGNYWADRPIHRILVYTEHGLTPEVVEAFFREVECETVYDPFAGSGTVGVEALLRGRGFVGVDASPAAVVVAAAKVSPEAGVSLRPDPRLANYYSEETYERLLRLSRRVHTALEAGVFFNVARRFSKFEYSPAPRFRRGDPQGDPEEHFRALLETARRDLRLLGGRRGDVLLGDSTWFMPRRVCGVLTSPPFANNVDYVRHTHIELLWLGVDPSRARDLQLPACEAAARSWRQHMPLNLEPGGRRARGYQRFLGQYFYYMRQHIRLLAQALEAEAWYTIGDSVLGGVYVPVHEILARFGEEEGLGASLVNLGERRMRRGRRLFLLRFRSRR
ncbi:MAG: site-specific DNA-methyltransferase [Thermoproteaceae archaeon]|nr:site-specific DNA-methyltransferase [Thermoproteaceae archaeon]